MKKTNCPYENLKDGHKHVYGQCVFCGVRGGVKTYEERVREAGEATTPDQRAEFLRLMMEERKNLGEAAGQVGISTDAAMWILLQEDAKGRQLMAREFYRDREKGA